MQPLPSPAPPAEEGAPLTATLRRLGGQALWRYLNQGAEVGSGLIVMLVLTRAMGAAGYGAYSTVISYVLFGIALASLGLPLITLRDLARAPDPVQVLSRVLGLQLVLGLLVLTAGAAFAWQLNYQPAVRVSIAIFSVAGLAVLLTTLIQHVLTVHWRMKEHFIGTFVGRAVSLAAMTVAIQRVAGLEWIVIAYASGFAVQLWLTWHFARRLQRVRIAWAPAAWRALLQSSTGSTVMSMFFRAAGRLDMVLVSLLPLASARWVVSGAASNEEAVGFYAVANRLLVVVVVLPILLFQLALPPYIRERQARPDTAHRLWQAVTDWLCVVGTWIGVEGIVFAPQIVHVLAGPGFEPAILPLRITCAGLPILFVARGYSQLLVALGHEQRLTRVYVLYSVALCGLLTVATVTSTFVGAATALALMWVVVLVGDARLARPYVTRGLSLRGWISSVPLAGALGGCQWAMTEWLLPRLIQSTSDHLLVVELAWTGVLAVAGTLLYWRIHAGTARRWAREPAG